MIVEWIVKRAFKKLLKKVKKAALNPEQIKSFGKALRRNHEDKLYEWAVKAAGTDSDYDDAALLLAQSWFKSRYLDQKIKNGN